MIPQISECAPPIAACMKKMIPQISECALPIAACMAFIAGEYQQFLDSPLRDVVENLLTVPATFPPSVVCMCVWTSVKLLVGAAARPEEIVSDEQYAEVRSLILKKLPEFVLSSQVEVSERATLAWFVVEHHCERKTAGGLFAGLGTLETLA